MSEWREVMENRSGDGHCRERHVLTVYRGRYGRPTAWVSAIRRADSLHGHQSFWETALVTPRMGPQRFANHHFDIIVTGGVDRRAECVGKTVEELLELFRSWSAG